MNRLLDLRKKKGVRQQDIADYMTVAKSTYSYWESGKIEINNNNLFRLADYFDVTVDYLLGRTNDPNPQKKDPINNDEVLKFALYGDTEIDDAVLDEVKTFAQFARAQREAKKNRG